MGDRGVLEFPTLLTVHREIICRPESARGEASSRPDSVRPLAGSSGDACSGDRPASSVAPRRPSFGVRREFSSSAFTWPQPFTRIFEIEPFPFLLCCSAGRTLSNLPCRPCEIDETGPFCDCCPLLPEIYPWSRPPAPRSSCAH